MRSIHTTSITAEVTLPPPGMRSGSPKRNVSGGKNTKGQPMTGGHGDGGAMRHQPVPLSGVDVVLGTLHALHHHKSSRWHFTRYSEPVTVLMRTSMVIISE